MSKKLLALALVFTLLLSAAPGALAEGGSSPETIENSGGTITLTGGSTYGRGATTGVPDVLNITENTTIEVTGTGAATITGTAINVEAGKTLTIKGHLVIGNATTTLLTSGFTADTTTNNRSNINLMGASSKLIISNGASLDIQDYYTRNAIDLYADSEVVLNGGTLKMTGIGSERPRHGFVGQGGSASFVTMTGNSYLEVSVRNNGWNGGTLTMSDTSKAVFKDCALNGLELNTLTMSGSSELTVTGNARNGLYILGGAASNISDNAKLTVTGNEPTDVADKANLLLADNAKLTVAHTATFIVSAKDAGELTQAVTINNATIKLANDVTVDSVITINKNLTLDLNGHTLTGSAATGTAGIMVTADATIKNGTVTGYIPLYVRDATATIDSVTLTGTLYGIQLGHDSGDGAIGNAVVNGASQITGNDYAGIVIFAHKTTGKSQLTINNGTVQGKYFGISGNGNWDKTEIILNGGIIKGTNTSDSAGIYHPQGGTLTVNAGATIEGLVGLQVLGGTVTINGGILKSTDSAARTAPYKNPGEGDGNILDGSALSVVSRAGYGDVSVTVKGGTFTTGNAANAAVKQYGYTKESSTYKVIANPTNVDFTITGGTFDTDPGAYVASGYVVSGSGPYIVSAPYVAPAPSAPEVVEAPVSGDEGTVTVPVEVDTEAGEASLIVDEEKLEEIVSSGAASGTVTIDVSGLDESVTSVSIPAAAVAAINESVQDPEGAAESLAVALPAATIEFDAASLGEIAKAAGEDPEAPVRISAETLEPASLPAAQQALLPEDAVVLDLTVTVGEQAVSDFGGGAVTVRLPYTPPAAAAVEHLVVWFLSDDGRLVPCDHSYENGELVFRTTHFSKYVVGVFPFGDVDAGRWYYAAVVRAFNAGLMDGVGETSFAPEAAATRGMLVQILWRLEGKPEAESAGFTDVEADAWYEGAVNWAADAGLVDGFEDGSFHPTAEVTREQLAAILYRYAAAKGYDTAATDDLAAFTDAPEGWSAPYLRWAVGAGLMEGKGEGLLAPLAGAKRAEAAALLLRFGDQFQA